VMVFGPGWPAQMTSVMNAATDVDTSSATAPAFNGEEASTFML